MSEDYDDSLPDDICRNKHGGNEESEDANLFTDKERDRGRILEVYKERENAIADEVAVTLSMPSQTCSARHSELRKDGILIKTGERRPTRTGAMAAVLRLRTVNDMEEV